MCSRLVFYLLFFAQWNLLNMNAQCEYYKVGSLAQGHFNSHFRRDSLSHCPPRFIFLASILHLVVRNRTSNDYIYPFQRRYSHGQMYCSIYNSNYLPQLVRLENGNISVWEIFINMVNTDDYISINNVQRNVLDMQ